jgi:hypothetical protein
MCNAFPSIRIVFGFYPQLLLFGWWYGVDLEVWQRFSIPSANLLALKPDSMNSLEMFTFIAIASCITMLGFMAFTFGFTDVTLSMIMTASGIVYLLMPSPVPFKSARFKFLSSLRQCVLASFGCVPVEFWHTFVT